ncbi:ribbon-helix-helix protein, CopG family [Acinetobacter sp. Marseille-Q1623]|uniref:ribbon-helix-helix protein, CopG family n=1 Tax=Acinetobacter sp. Marseille-Q1623 TaxID=2697501 RepID=UPI00157A7D22|nr:ribbon-helix-helix protein, CopG family [Acinetobacter sp. Marseille-Q1623]
MAKSRIQINADSDANRGFVSKSYKLHTSTVQQIKDLSSELNISQGQIIAEALKCYVAHVKKPN